MSEKCLHHSACRFSVGPVKQPWPVNHGRECVAGHRQDIWPFQAIHCQLTPPLQLGSGKLCPQPDPCLPDLHWLENRQSEAVTHCSIHWKNDQMKQSPFECHILFLFNEFFIVWSPAEVHTTVNYTSFYLWLWMMSLEFQLQHERMFVQLSAVGSGLSWQNSESGCCEQLQLNDVKPNFINKMNLSFKVVYLQMLKIICTI